MDNSHTLPVGTVVNIQRRDGRLQTARISRVILKTHSVLVEWEDSGELMAKNIDIGAILALNPGVAERIEDDTTRCYIQQRRVTRGSSRLQAVNERVLRNTQRLPSISAIAEHGNTYIQRGLENIAAKPPSLTARENTMLLQQQPETAQNTERVLRKTQRLSSNPAIAGHSNTHIQRGLENIAAKSATLITREHTMLLQQQRQSIQQQPGTPQSTEQALWSTKRNKNSPAVAEHRDDTHTQIGLENISPKLANLTVRQSTMLQQRLSTDENTGAGKPRRGLVVTQVDKLKKYRDERRQRQAELKEEKERLKNMDRDNPNWEFLAMIREYCSGIEFRPLRETDPVEDRQITVCVRKRPLNKEEMKRKEVDVITVPMKDQLIVHEPKSKVDLTKYLENQILRFDYTFDDTCSNELVYKYTAKPLIRTVFEGGNATCFAYGQTGSGKTHTMGGDFHGGRQDCSTGIYAMTAEDVFNLVGSPTYKSSKLMVSASFFEIYSGKVFDLLANKAKLKVLEDGKQQVQIVGLTEKVVWSVEEVLELIQRGNNARTSGQTSANKNSSRSHAIFQIVLRATGVNKIHGKFSLIDLAGSERGADTAATNRQTRMEGAEINKSLLALKECIRALGRKGAHLPFRGSKLTQVLKDSFTGENSRTCMIAMVSPGMSSCEHTLNTLRYADRVKELNATEPTEIKSTDGAETMAVNDSLDGGLAQADEMSQEVYTFHEAISHLQMLEEEVIDSQKQLLERNPHWHHMAEKLFVLTNEVDYDQDAYSKKLDELLNAALEVRLKCKEKVAAFRAQLEAEEVISQKIKHPLRRH